MSQPVDSPASPDTRETILRSALGLFSDRGFDGCTNREIAARAGVNHGLITYYFGSKQKLWQEAVDVAFAEMGAGIRELLEDASITDERERAARVIRAHVHFVARNPEFVRLMHDEGKRRGPRMRWIVDRHVKPMYEAVCGLFERARASGALQLDVPPVHLFYILAGSVGMLFHQAEECRRVTGTDPFDPAVVEAHARAVERMLLGEP